MHHQIDHIHAIQADRLRAAERYRLARQVPSGPSIWTRLAGHLSARSDRGARTKRPEGRHGAAGLIGASTHNL